MGALFSKNNKDERKYLKFDWVFSSGRWGNRLWFDSIGVWEASQRFREDQRVEVWWAILQVDWQIR